MSLSCNKQTKLKMKVAEIAKNLDSSSFPQQSSSPDMLGQGNGIEFFLISSVRYSHIYPKTSIKEPSF